MIFLSNQHVLITAALAIQYCCPVLTQYSALLDLFGLHTGRSGTVADRIPTDDIASQSLALMNYIQSLQRNPDNQLNKRLREPFPQVALLDGIPAVPGIIGSFPGAGGCLPYRTPLVNQRSPSLFQDFLRFIPGAQDYLSSLIKTPDIDVNSLLGKYYWVISTAGVHDRYCPTTEFRNYVKMKNTSSFTTFDSFRVGNSHGDAKMGFGYGIIHNQKVYIYVQEDPCPYQIVMTGPKNAKNGQYEYILMTNWAKFPLVAMVRSLAEYNANYRNELIQRLKDEGYIHVFSKIIGSSVHQIDWTGCKPLTPIAIVSNVINRLLFGS